ncbi:MAG: terminase large subunit domain-containing protein, partial [Terriglobia bacterium]
MKKPRTKRASTRRLRVRVKLYPYQQRWVEDNARFKIACKARQVGFSFAAALRVVRRRQKKPGLTVWLSASERQALEAMEHIRHHVGGTKVIAEYSESFVEATSMKQHEVRLPNGSRIVALPANPDTVRGFAGDVVLDEFAFHRDAEAIWRAAFATATRGFQLEIISTPNGTRGKFYELARQAGLVDYTPSPNPFPVGQTFLSAHSAGGSAAAGAQHPFRTSESPVQRLALSEVAGLPLPGAQADAEANGFVAATGSPWSPHWVDLVTARAHGFVVDVESLRAAIADEDAWQQEYCCRFLTEAAHYIPPEMVVAAEHPAATTSLPLSATSVDPAVSDSTGRGSPVAGHLYLGVDIGRRRDLTVLWLVEVENESASPEARTYLTRTVLTLERQPFAR